MSKKFENLAFILPCKVPAFFIILQGARGGEPPPPRRVPIPGCVSLQKISNIFKSLGFGLSLDTFAISGGFGFWKFWYLKKVSDLVSENLVSEKSLRFTTMTMATMGKLEVVHKEVGGCLNSYNLPKSLWVHRWHQNGEICEEVMLYCCNYHLYQIWW